MEPQQILSPISLGIWMVFCKAIKGGHAPPLPPQLVSLDLDISAILWDSAITTDYGSWRREISKALVINCDSPLASAL